MATPLIRLSGATHRYSTSADTALQSVDLTIEAGELVALTGPSGSGKSTLLNIIGLLEPLMNGEYALSGAPTAAMGERARDLARATTFGFVFQSSHVIPDQTTLANAALGLQVLGVPADLRAARARAALEAVGLSDRAEQQARLLSGGERQRLAIARALVTDPAAILADEPTGNLDSANGAAVLGLLRAIHAQGRTVILVTHDQAIAAAADRRIILRDGRIAADSGPLATQRTVLPQQSVESEPPDLRQGLALPGMLLEDAVDAMGGWFRRPMRSLLLLLAFVLGIAGLVSAEGLSQSAAAQVSDRFTAAALDQVRVDVAPTPDMWDPGNDRLAHLQRRLAALPRVQAAAWTAVVAPADVMVTRLSPWESEPGAISLAAASGNYFELAGGRLSPHLVDLLDDGKGVVIATGAADKLGVPHTSPTPPGVTVWIDQRIYPVIGVVEFPAEEGAPSRFEDSVFIARPALASSGQVSVTFHGRTDPGFPEVVAPAIPYALAPEAPGSVEVHTVADLLDLRVGVADDLSRFVLILAAVVLALACLAGAVSMHLSVLARTAEIGLRRALGTPRVRVFRLFLFDGLALGLLGGAVGALLGQLATLGIASSLTWQPVLPGSSGVLGAAVGTLCGLVASAGPALAAARRAPAQAIRD